MWLVFNRSSSRGAARSRQFFVQTVLGKSVQSNRERETKQVHGFGSKSKCEVVGGLNSRGVVRTEVPGQWWTGAWEGHQVNAWVKGKLIGK